MSRIAIIGTTTWGKTLCVILASNGLEVSLWARTEQEAIRLKNEGPNPDLFPDGSFPVGVSITSILSEALTGTDAVILAVPSQKMRENIRLAGEYLSSSTLVVSAAKGLELVTNKRMSQVIAEEIPSDLRTNICVLSGPNLSREVIRNLPAATVVAAESEAIAARAHLLLTSPNFCVYTNTDVIGVELGGALKNIIALGAGMVDGLGLGDNTRAAFITRGLTEIAALGVALGANPLTFSGLAGLGDLIATCTSTLSRNHHVGVELAKGHSLDAITRSMTAVAEGINTTIGARNLARQLGLGMPVTEKIYQVLFEGAAPNQVVAEVVSVEASHELDGRNWELFSFSNHRNHT
ncbi:MAG: NAD(P)-dependent glycerol-3-phosphate dehydrogenase [Dehalococcoidales bacterium]|nr:NAD(P)-dependent glycerol-3-phosphate dehydrogenase [Dehalococcoidales bacterium]